MVRGMTGSGRGLSIPLRISALAFLSLVAVLVLFTCDSIGGLETASAAPPPRDRDGDGSYTPQDCNDDDASIHPGAQDVCDGADNDCNVDTADGAGDPDQPHNSNQEGVCAGSKQSCVGGAWEDYYSEPTIPGYSPSEICGDGLDNDCNGQIDDVGCPSTTYRLEFIFEDLTGSESYSAWLPTDGGKAKVTVQVVDEGGNPVNDVPDLAFAISEDAEGTEKITAHQGRFTNDPTVVDVNPADGQEDRDFRAVFDGSTVVLTSYDFGGSITLRATATAPDSAFLDSEFVIPRDTDGDGMADSWENKDDYGGLSLTRDGDADASLDPADTTKTGDGLSNFQEYRGFMWGRALVRLDPSDSTTPVTNPYQTAAYLASEEPPEHFRTDPTRKDLFLRFQDYDYWMYNPTTKVVTELHDAPCDCPFALGEAYATAGIDVHAYNTNAPPDGVPPDVQGIDYVHVRNDLVNYYSGEVDAHIHKDTGRNRMRTWYWSVKGVSGQGTDNVYGSGTKTFQKCLDAYFDEKPYEDGQTWNPSTEEYDLQADNLLNTYTEVEDGDDDGDLGSREDSNNNNKLDGDHWKGAGVFNMDLTVFNIDRDQWVELPEILDPTLLLPPDPDTPQTVLDADGVTVITREYSRPHVLKHTITHELGHAVGVPHITNDTGALMSDETVDYHRDGSFTSAEKVYIRIHNK